MKTSKLLKVLSILGIFCAYGCTDDSAATKAECGNGILESTEACDDNNTQGGDGCSEDCSAIEDGYECKIAGQRCTKKSTGDIDPPSEGGPVCGNGIRDPKESCDDGNTDDGDGCSADCRDVEIGYICTTPGELCVKD